MSMNLTLDGFALRQTPTEVTMRALAHADPSVVYIDWLYQTLGPKPGRQAKADADEHVRQLLVHLKKRAGQRTTIWGRE